MATQEISKVETPTITESLYESLALRGDISALKPKEKVAYYRQFCERLGLDPLGQPFLPLRLGNREILYATRAATDQLARIHGVSREVVTREQISDVYVVKVRATILATGRTEESIGAVAIGGLKGEALGNALMKAETKGKRRVTLSILGLGMLDETEIATIPQNQREAIQAYPIETTEVDNTANPGTEPTTADKFVEVMAEDDAAQDEHQKLQARLLQEIQQLRDLGVGYSEIQAQMERVTGCKRRDELDSDQLEKAITSFGEWSQELAIKIRAKGVQ